MLDLPLLATRLERLAQASSTVADGVQRECTSELSRQATAVAADLGAMAVMVRGVVEETKRATTDLAGALSRVQARLCVRCHKAPGGVDGLCPECEAELEA